MVVSRLARVSHLGTQPCRPLSRCPTPSLLSSRPPSRSSWSWMPSTFFLKDTTNNILCASFILFFIFSALDWLWILRHERLFCQARRHLRGGMYEVLEEQQH